MRHAWLFILGMAAAAAAGAAMPLQPLLDATPSGGTLTLAPGDYAGPATVDRPMIVEGHGAASLGNLGKGTVLTVHTRRATIRGLTIRGSGSSNDGMDAGILVEGDDNLIETNVLEDVLFGIHVKQGRGNRIVGNRVRGKPLGEGLRGDGLRLWNSRNNLIDGNRFERVRDLTFANSPDNVVTGNVLRDGRYGMHFIFSPGARVERNDIAHTSTGIVILYSPKMTLRGNSLAHVAGGGGACITFKESGEALVEDNTLLHCAVGFQANAPLEESAVITLKGNRFSHNTTAIYFYGEKGGHRILENRFEHNLTQVAVSAVSVGGDNVWSGNHWSDYQGFDRNDDGIGDSPHEVFVFADRIWMEEPITTFFRNSPAFELLDFLERLAPFAAPAKILSDPRPRFR